MQGAVGLLNVITVPPGAIPGQQRIVIDGVRGAIFEYANGAGLGNTLADNPLVGSWAAAAGTDPYGNAYPQGLQIQGTIEGNSFILNSNGFFLYSGPPGPGNLIGAWTSAAGTDQFGNAYPSGFFMGGSGLSGAYFRIDQNGVVYLFNAAGNNIIRLNPTRQAVYIYNSSGGASGNLIVSLASVAGTDPFGNTVPLGLAAANINDTIFAQVEAGQFNIYGFNSSVPGGLVFFGNSSTQNVTFTSGIVAGNTACTLELIDSGGLAGVPEAVLSGELSTTSSITAQAGGLNWNSPGGTLWGAPGALNSNFTVNTVTAASFSNLTNFTIASGDVSTGSVYKITAWGNGVWGSTAQALTMELTLGGTQIAEVSIGAGAFSASAVFTWEAELYITPHGLGASATWDGMLRLTVTQQANAATGLTAAANSVTVEGNPLAPVGPISTLTSQVFELAAMWAATTGAPTITKRVAWLEKRS